MSSEPPEPAQGRDEAPPSEEPKARASGPAYITVDPGVLAALAPGLEIPPAAPSIDACVADLEGPSSSRSSGSWFDIGVFLCP